MTEDIVAIARRWLGTPYEHQASCLGAGADCLGLIRGIWRTLYDSEPVPIPPYTPDWSEPARDEVLLRAANRYFTLNTAEMALGDVLVFRMRARRVAKHLAIVSALKPNPKIIHAYSGQGVVETPLSPAWERRIAGVFQFPDRRK
ncbi:MAG: peptidase [Paracoccaceae bacterium]